MASSLLGNPDTRVPAVRIGLLILGAIVLDVVATGAAIGGGLWALRISAAHGTGW